MNKEKVRKEIIALRKSANVAYVGSVNGEGFPQIKGMLVLESESMKVQYFSTNTGSRRVAQFRANPKACVYYVDDTKDKYKGALFTGTIEVCTDHETKAMLWRDGFEMYYPKGVDDPGYCVCRFTAQSVKYYHGLANMTLQIEEIG